jgi:pyruvate/2-oxoglutarate dehydrogenase complex dihydrolipoamide dehydrogenase (E3) component
MMQWVHQVINHLRGGTIEQARDHLVQQGIDVIHGEATFVSPHEVSIGGRVVSAERILIATGSETLLPPIEGLEEAGYITNIEAVSLPSLPRRMAIAGGGALGIEFAQMFHRFGVDVIVLEKSPTILDKEDRELAEKLCQMLTDEGIRLETDAELKRVERVGDGKRLTVKYGKRGEEKLEVDELLMALGRKAAFEVLHLEKAGVKTSEKGVIVDTTLRTNVPYIWAAGDVASKYQFTHVASAQGKLVAHNAFSEHAQAFDDRVIPWVTFTNPALAHVGKTEEELREEGTEYRVARMPFSENERAIMVGETEGLLKLLVDAKGNILGGHILGERADDLIAPIVLAMHANMPVEKLASVILPYPTMSESLSQAAQKL